MLIHSPYHTKFVDTMKHKEHQTNKVLVSYTRKVKKIDPVGFFQMNRSVYTGERFFWQSPDDPMTIVGIGLLRTFLNHRADDRFSQIEKEWRELLSRAVIDNPTRTEGTGPLLFGGFSFDPYSVKEEMWQPFGDTLFYLPEYMLTILNEDCYITVNQFENSEMSRSSNQIKKMFDLFLKNADSYDVQAPSISSKEELSVPEWLTSVSTVINKLKTTDTVDKVVLARKLKLGFSQPVLTDYVLKELRVQQKNSFIFLLETADGGFIGASPERLVQKKDDLVLSTSLAGSIGRHVEPEEDKKLGDWLLKDEKNRYEHALVVQMIRRALQPYCKELHIPEEPILLKTPYIQHLYTPVSGTARPETSIFHLVGELHPTPALGGVPTREAMKMIRDQEKMDRGFYAAPVGWTDYRGNGEFIVAIRSGLIKNQEAFLYAGCGLVADSDPEEELKETGIKFQPMLKAMGGSFE
ncbi:isochorismate synthase MenF [Siminovitchia sediminis]|uniref:isochorismate synthase n=1 Tax=Siminovitchia sediminis TaxID=1274353 RepID=A0ABW4KHL4_9BACI